MNGFIRSFNTTEEGIVNQNSIPSENKYKSNTSNEKYESNKKIFPMTKNRENLTPADPY